MLGVVVGIQGRPAGQQSRTEPRGQDEKGAMAGTRMEPRRQTMARSLWICPRRPAQRQGRDKKTFFFGWRLLGLIPGGTPFSQLNKGVRDVMSATTKRDVEHQVCTKTCTRPQVPTKSKHRAKNAESQEGTKKRAPVKSKGKHLCQSGKMQPEEEGFGETRRKHLCRSQKCA